MVPQTLPATVTPETNSRMKPSQALRLGRMIYPEVVADVREGNAFCAMGLINHMRGDSLLSMSPLNRDALMLTGTKLFSYPCGCFGGRKMSLPVVVMHLSDQHDYIASLYDQSSWFGRLRWRFSNLPRYKRWTQNDIINWLESEGL